MRELDRWWNWSIELSMKFIVEEMGTVLSAVPVEVLWQWKSVCWFLGCGLYCYERSDIHLSVSFVKILFHCSMKIDEVLC